MTNNEFKDFADNLGVDTSFLEKLQNLKSTYSNSIKEDSTVSDKQVSEAFTEVIENLQELFSKGLFQIDKNIHKTANNANRFIFHYSFSRKKNPVDDSSNQYVKLDTTFLNGSPASIVEFFYTIAHIMKNSPDKFTKEILEKGKRWFEETQENERK